MYDAANGHRLIDFYGFFGSRAVAFNHPYFDRPEVERDLLRAAKVKVANSDVYSQAYAEFVETFARVVGLPTLDRFLFIEGGALAVENTLKAAMDWKVRKNMAAGRGERGTQILHFRRAFHGRSGYTMSLTNTDPRKTDLLRSSTGHEFPHRRFFACRKRNSRADVDGAGKKAENGDSAILVAERGVDIAAIIHRAHPGRGRRQPFSRRMVPDLAQDLR